MMTIQKFMDMYRYSDTKIAQIVESAISYHEKTNQRYGDDDSLPYGYHLVNVVQTAITNLSVSGEGIHYLVFAAAFHDAIEDARLTYNDVLKEAGRLLGTDYGQDIAATEIVYALTNEKGRTRDERANNKYYEGILETAGARYIKLCDRYANMLYSLTESKKCGMSTKYKKELPSFFEKLYIEPTPFGLQPCEAKVVKLIKKLV